MEDFFFYVIDHWVDEECEKLLAELDEPCELSDDVAESAKEAA